MLQGASFKTLLHGAGYTDGGAASQLSAPPELSVRCSVSGPEPGYIATSAMFAAVGRTILEHRQSLRHQGGVFTPGGLFGSSGPAAVDKLIQQLGNNGIRVAVDSPPSSPARGA